MAWYTGANKCIYSCSGAIELPLEQRVCFVDAFRRLYTDKKSAVDYKIYIDQFDKDSASNFCTPEEIKYTLNKLRRIVPFSFKLDFTPHTFDRQPYGVLNLHIEGDKLTHKMILTFTRCFFEYPSNVAAREAIDVYPEIIRRLRVGNSISWFNVFITIESCCVARGGGHTFTCSYQPDSPLFTTDEMINRIHDNPNISLNNFFGCGNERLRHDDYEFPNTMEKLTNEKLIEKRIQHYVELLKTKLQWLR